MSMTCCCLCRYLLNSGAYPVPVNSDGDTPRDTAEDDEVLELLQGAIESQGMMMWLLLVIHPSILMLNNQSTRFTWVLSLKTTLAQ